ncbi:MULTISPECIES: class I adenylate-forming enzyme family protein [Cupriavidus]|uniref:AMP-binding protein n=1 Tax=Cupriavidus basilensis TaxID=68895 RepID=A0A643G4R0_9BURK|nr:MULTISPECIES: AMP-binding protein [Cupriavidus]KUE88041.1 long-chain fatty acid--CoA ligase [Cupriavidus necator]NOV23819.1 long-chain fatty acid--CoA ligase [Cupriavidus necator]QOT81866.1 AMP-binding protein [Cupriavidus basilensis]BDB30272.1 AMP-binding protein [Cupriavidus sp. P-10]
MATIASLPQMLSLHAQRTPNKIGAQDLERSLTFRQWHQRSRKLANALLGLGLKKGDRVCVLAYNSIEWLEIYAATAIAGLIAVPVNFRLVGTEIAYIAQNCDARAFLVQAELLGPFEDARRELSLPERNCIVFGSSQPAAGFSQYEALIAAAADTEPASLLAADDPWTLMYTSGTTGKPKGALRSHAGSASLSLATLAEMGLSHDDGALLVMPLCHANSLYFFGAFLYAGATCTVYSRKSFDPEHLLQTFSTGESTFTSLVPTHYTMMLGLEPQIRNHYDVSRVRKLMISSAPARRETKLEILEYFKNSGLYEMYGSTETGWVTMLHPNEQLSKLGSVGRECVGGRRIRFLDQDGNEVPDGQPGELYASNPYLFDGYWGLPEKTQDAFRGEYCTVGDFGFRDEDGYIHLVDRKSNMIISGGENIYPSEVETMLAAHPKVGDVAVIGLSDEKWGERVHAVVVPRVGETLTPDEVIAWCKDRIAGYKRPRSVSFICDGEMPRTATGKIQHRLLRTRFAERDGNH